MVGRLTSPTRARLEFFPSPQIPYFDSLPLHLHLTLVQLTADSSGPCGISLSVSDPLFQVNPGCCNTRMPEKPLDSNKVRTPLK